jgi:hypothetical protein
MKKLFIMDLLVNVKKKDGNLWFTGKVVDLQSTTINLFIHCI